MYSLKCDDILLCISILHNILYSQFRTYRWYDTKNIIAQKKLIHVDHKHQYVFTISLFVS